MLFYCQSPLFPCYIARWRLLHLTACATMAADRRDRPSFELRFTVPSERTAVVIDA